MKIISWNVNSVRARIENILNYIKDKINHNPDLAIVLGSGLADLQNILTNKIVIKYIFV